MSSFTQDPNILHHVNGKHGWVTKGFRWYFDDTLDGDYIEIEPDMFTDGNSAPWPFSMFIERWAYIQATLVHDKMCVQLKDVYGQKFTDQNFRKMLTTLGMKKSTAQMWYLGVRAFQLLYLKRWT